MNNLSKINLNIQRKLKLIKILEKRLDQGQDEEIFLLQILEEINKVEYLLSDYKKELCEKKRSIKKNGQ